MMYTNQIPSTSVRAIRSAGVAAVAACLVCSAFGCRQGRPAGATAPVALAAARKVNNAPPPAPVPPELPKGGVRGIYLTGWTAGLSKRFPALVGLVDRTELNAMVIDVKDDGAVSYDMDVPLVKQAHLSQRMFKVDKVMAVLNKHHIFPIARITCMRDTPLAEAHPEMAIHAPDGSVWHDHSHHAWLNPYNKKVWDYNVDVALDAVNHGFKEIQFDYVRFPSEGKISTLRYPGKPKGALRKDQIEAFVKYAREKIKATGAYFSADVFGLTSLVTSDMGIGQTRTNVAKHVDFLCPMVYPSHYAHGEYGIPNPNTEPYKIVHLSVGDAQKRLKDIPTCGLRPWIQDFTLYGVHYGPAQVKAQIKALHDLGIHQFLLWNAGNKYTESALAHTKTPDEPKVAIASSKPGPAPKTVPAATKAASATTARKP